MDLRIERVRFTRINTPLRELRSRFLVGKVNRSLSRWISYPGTHAQLRKPVFDNGFAFSATSPQTPPLLTISAPIGLQYGNQIGDD
jgi:hypothetical protein